MKSTPMTQGEMFVNLIGRAAEGIRIANYDFLSIMFWYGRLTEALIRIPYEEFPVNDEAWETYEDICEMALGIVKNHAKEN